MTKKHFIKLANMIRNDGTFTANQQNEIANVCASINPLFNKGRWLNYIAGECGPNGGAIKQTKSDNTLQG